MRIFLSRLPWFLVVYSRPIYLGVYIGHTWSGKPVLFVICENHLSYLDGGGIAQSRRIYFNCLARHRKSVESSSAIRGQKSGSGLHNTDCGGATGIYSLSIIIDRRDAHVLASERLLYHFCNQTSAVLFTRDHSVAEFGQSDSCKHVRDKASVWFNRCRSVE